MTGPAWRGRLAIAAELTLVALLLLGYRWFFGYQVILLVLLASQSLWLRRLGWADVGLRRPASVPRAVLGATLAALAILVAFRLAIVPAATALAGGSVDLSTLGAPGDERGLLLWLVFSWSIAAFGEEMVFRGYLMHRIVDLVGGTRAGWGAALLASSALFGLGHLYQGWAGVIATGITGCLLALLYLRGERNLWPVILCHGLIDTVAMLAIYWDRTSLLLPEAG